jgi:hypothetical protein
MARDSVAGVARDRVRDRLHFRLRARQRDTAPHPADEHQIALRAIGPPIYAKELAGCLDWHPDIHRHADETADRRRFRDPYDRVGRSVQENGSPEHRFAAESVPPQGIADDRCRRRAGRIVCVDEQTALGGTDAEQRQVSTRDDLAEQLIGPAVGIETEGREIHR